MKIKTLVSSRSVGMRDIKAVFPSPLAGEGARRAGEEVTCNAFPARFVIPQACNAGYSGRPGFTLLELLVVVLIIGILAAIALPQYQKAVWRSRATEVKVFATNLQNAQSVHRLHNSVYAQDFSQMDVKL